MKLHATRYVLLAGLTTVPSEVTAIPDTERLSLSLFAQSASAYTLRLRPEPRTEVMPRFFVPLRYDNIFIIVCYSLSVGS